MVKADREEWQAVDKREGMEPKEVIPDPIDRTDYEGETGSRVQC